MNEENNLIQTDATNVVEYEIETIKNMIYTIRGKQVMLDSDVARLYHCETRVINQAVKRNIERFPRLTSDEILNLKSQNVISSLMKENSYGGKKKTTDGIYRTRNSNAFRFIKKCTGSTSKH